MFPATSKYFEIGNHHGKMRLCLKKLKVLVRRKFLTQKPLQDLAQSPADSDAYPVFPPPTPEELLAHADFYRERLSQRRWRTPKDQPEDTPLFSLYRLYERMVLNDNIGLRNEIEYLFYARWPVASIPDPQDSFISRYAVLSTIPAL
ncbi:uncharacterized protein BDV14DRAFT_56127 [Aspergillus stella-maris]|uniref:uncharacterized protein n=1 Tax=Aspergillus stella-maris TaxID=1810926 RepID=UPI003CCE45F8